MEVGREIRQLREAKGWSQTKLAADAGMGVSGISQIETGARNPSMTTLARIAGALGVEVADLFPKAEAQLPLDYQGNGGAAGPHDDPSYPTIAEMLIDSMFEQASQYRQAFQQPSESGTTQEHYLRYERALMDRLLRLPKAEVAQACIDLARGYLCIASPAAAPLQDSSKEGEAFDPHEYAAVVDQIMQEASTQGVTASFEPYEKSSSGIPRIKIASGRKVGSTKTPRKTTRKKRAKEQ